MSSKKNVSTEIAKPKLKNPSKSRKITKVPSKEVRQISQPQNVYSAVEGEEIVEKQISSLNQAFPDMRGKYDKKTIGRYSEADHEKLPPVTLAKCEQDDEINEKVIDGWFTILALKQAGKNVVKCRYESVENRNDAYVKALKNNCHHGKHLTRKEKALAAKKLQDEGVPQTEIGKILAVHQSNVSRMINDLEQEDMRLHKKKLLLRTFKRVIKLLTELEDIEELVAIKEAIDEHVSTLETLVAQENEQEAEEPLESEEPAAPVDPEEEGEMNAEA